MRRDTGLGVYALQYHAEMEPKRESRVSLSEKLDRSGVPELSINLMFSENEAESIVRSHDVLDKALREQGMASIDYLDPAEARAANVLSQARDGYHQLGTTRMGIDPGKSVVDKDCRVHGIGNLFVASSSVFPTSGHAQPYPARHDVGRSSGRTSGGIDQRKRRLRGPSDAGEQISRGRGPIGNLALGQHRRHGGAHRRCASLACSRITKRAAMLFALGHSLRGARDPAP